MTFEEVGKRLKTLPDVSSIDKLGHQVGPEWHVKFNAKDVGEAFISVNFDHTCYCGFFGSIHNESIPKDIRDLVEKYITTDKQKELF